MPAKKTAKKSKAKPQSTPSDDTEIRATFKKLVNMSAAQIEKFLATQDSKRVGFKKGGKGESVGHDSGRKIIKIKAKKSRRTGQSGHQTHAQSRRLHQTPLRARA